jgi:hypothetical protein
MEMVLIFFCYSANFGEFIFIFFLFLWNEKYNYDELGTSWCVSEAVLICIEGILTRVIASVTKGLDIFFLQWLGLDTWYRLVLHQHFFSFFPLISFPLLVLKPTGACISIVTLSKYYTEKQCLAVRVFLPWLVCILPIPDLTCVQLTMSKAILKLRISGYVLFLFLLHLMLPFLKGFHVW